MGPFHAALGLAGIGAENLDVELRQSTAELGHAVSAGGILPRYPKDRMLVGIERNRLAMVLQIALQGLEIGKRALGWDKAKLHQSASGVVDEHQKRAGRRPIFEPAMVRTVDLDQLADMLTTMARLLDAFALRPGQPDPCLPHPAAQRLSRHAHIMALAQLLGRQRRAKVVVLPDQRDGLITHD